MAPNLNSLGSDGRWGYSTPGSDGYDVPDIIYNVSVPITSMYRTQAEYALGPVNQEAEVVDNRNGLFWHSDGIPDPEVYEKCRTGHLRKEHKHRWDMAGEPVPRYRLQVSNT
jgi:hypothetical protein